MTKDIKYPEEIKWEEMLKRLEKLQAKLRRRKQVLRIETSTDASMNKVFFMNKEGLWSKEKGGSKWEKISEDIKQEKEDKS